MPNDCVMGLVAREYLWDGPPLSWVKVWSHKARMYASCESHSSSGQGLGTWICTSEQQAIEKMLAFLSRDPCNGKRVAQLQKESKTYKVVKKAKKSIAHEASSNTQPFLVSLFPLSPLHVNQQGSWMWMWLSPHFQQLPVFKIAPAPCLAQLMMY